MRYQEFAPPSGLAPFVRCFWSLRGMGNAGVVERVVPDGRQEIVFHLGVPFHQWQAARRVRQARALLVGQMDLPTYLEAGGAVDAFGVCFHAGGLSPFSRFAQAEVAGAIISLEDVWGAAARGLMESVANAPDHQRRIAALAEFLRARLRLLPEHAELASAVKLMWTRPDCRVTRLAEELGWSSRRMERLFATHVGLPPKTLARIARLRRVLHLRQSASYRNWAEAALESGYYDQAHLIADFRQFTGATPVWHQRELSQMERVFLRLA